MVAYVAQKKARMCIHGGVTCVSGQTTQTVVCNRHFLSFARVKEGVAC